MDSHVKDPRGFLASLEPSPWEDPLMRGRELNHLHAQLPLVCFCGRVLDPGVRFELHEGSLPGMRGSGGMFSVNPSWKLTWRCKSCGAAPVVSQQNLRKAFLEKVEEKWRRWVEFGRSVKFKDFEKRKWQLQMGVDLKG